MAMPRKQPFKKGPPKKGTAKTMNGTNKKRSNIGLSIEHLCDQIGKMAANILHTENISASGDVGISQMIAMSNLNCRDKTLELNALNGKLQVLNIW